MRFISIWTCLLFAVESFSEIDFLTLIYDNAPTTNPRSSWAKPAIINVIFAHMLNGFGLHWLDHCPTIKFYMPKEYRDGSETLTYTHALITSFSPINYQNDLQKTSKKTLIVIGENDEAMNAVEYKKLLPTNGNFDLIILPQVNHMSIVTNNDVSSVIGKWLKEKKKRLN
jgi:hypothetical protein